MERLAHVDAPALQVVERRRQVLYDEIEAPCTEPTGPWGMPLPMMIEHADPGGVSYTTRNCSLGSWSVSQTNPACR